MAYNQDPYGFTYTSSEVSNGTHAAEISSAQAESRSACSAGREIFRISSTQNLYTRISRTSSNREYSNPSSDTNSDGNPNSNPPSGDPPRNSIPVYHTAENSLQTSLQTYVTTYQQHEHLAYRLSTPAKHGDPTGAPKLQSQYRLTYTPSNTETVRLHSETAGINPTPENQAQGIAINHEGYYPAYSDTETIRPSPEQTRFQRWRHENPAFSNNETPYPPYSSTEIIRSAPEPTKVHLSSSNLAYSNIENLYPVQEEEQMGTYQWRAEDLVVGYGNVDSVGEGVGEGTEKKQKKKKGKKGQRSEKMTRDGEGGRSY